MKGRYTYLYFLILAVLIPIGVLVWNDIFIINHGDTYYVIEPITMAIGLACIYSFFTLNYFLLKSYTRNWFGLTNLFALLVPTIYFFYHQITGPTNHNVYYYIENPNAFDWETIYWPSIMQILFLLAILMFLINLSSKYWRRS